VAVGVAALFMEVHEDPDNAPSDGPNMVYLESLRGILETLVSLDHVIKGL
jgi:2-dehydro-3-deoxyphosphooctonate aldolase (KDO 8-P synthase)